MYSSFVVLVAVLLTTATSTLLPSTPTTHQDKQPLVNSRSYPKKEKEPSSLLDVADQGFLSSAMGSAAGAAMGGEVASVSDRENCVGCQFIWSKVNALLDQSSGYEAVKDAFERTCANMPNVFYDVCDTMFDREDELIQMYLNNMKFKQMCDKTQICLE
jgi:uncharacterized protein YfiM (DUF2279 family)